MPTMTAPTVMVPATELADVRRWAGETLDVAGPGDEYMATRVAAILAVLDWVERAAMLAPISRGLLEPTPENLAREQRRAVDAESELRRQRERGTYPGVVGETIAYLLGWAGCPI